jgi:hypothetical protein
LVLRRGHAHVLSLGDFGDALRGFVDVDAVNGHEQCGIKVDVLVPIGVPHAPRAETVELELAAFFRARAQVDDFIFCLQIIAQTQRGRLDEVGEVDERLIAAAAVKIVVPAVAGVEPFVKGALGASCLGTKSRETSRAVRTASC